MKTFKKGDAVKFLEKDSKLIEIIIKDGWKEEKPAKKSK